MLTMRKRLYAKARCSGKNQTDSAIFAGCPAKTAAQAASRYEKDPDVIALRSRLAAGETVEEPTPAPVPKTPKTPPAPAEKEVYQKPPAPPIKGDEDPLVFMRTMMCDPNEDPKLRLDAAKALAAYVHPKQGEKGKTELKKESAEKAHSKFKQAAAPAKLKVVSG